MRYLIAGSVLFSTLVFSCNSQDLTGVLPDGGAFEDGGTTGDMRGRLNADGACGSVRAEATLMKAPVDVIFVIDNSSSMTAEIQSVENNINANFAQIIQNSGLDYRIILIGRHGVASADQSICIKAPLAGNATCSTTAPINPAQPQNTARFFHYSTEVRSTDSYTVILNTYNAPDEFNLAPNGWSQWLRPNAIKTFIEITDDNSGTTETSFDSSLLALSPTQFGTAAQRKYVFHAICGVVENTPATAAWPPTAPVQTNRCMTNGAGSENASSVHQRLAILTGGLRFPICQYTNFDTVFQAVAAGVVSGSQISCDFPVPKPPPMKEYILSTAQLEYFPGNGGPSRILQQVPNAGACTPNSFYLQNERVYLCGTTCTEVQADQGARVEFLLECNEIIG
jgi:hypothetical protein